jgi:hypothetical protein
MSRGFDPADEDLAQRLAKSRERAKVALAEAAATRKCFAKLAAEQWDRASSAMEERCILAHRLAMSRIADLP